MQFIAYGLTIESEIQIPNLTACGSNVQVTVQLRQVEKPPSSSNALRTYAIALGEFTIFWRDVGTFLIRQGREIFIEPEPGVEESLIRLFLLGPVLAILMHQRGVLVIHASVVSIAGSAVGFMGEKGWGKSTTAAALNAKGHPLVADDILAVLPGPDGIPMVQPGPPHFKLWPDAAAASFGDDPSSLSRLHSQIEKRERFADTGFIEEPLPLRHLYVLDRGARLESVPLTPATALLALIRHSYLSTIMKSLDGQVENFRQCARLAQLVSVSSLMRPKDLDALGHIVQLVEREAARDRHRPDCMVMAPT